ncbi:MAG: thiamine phosphate synthase [Chloroflexi bacterium]|nr:thiamine phosphate synthase [Chloroflexota bacterium]
MIRAVYLVLDPDQAAGRPASRIALGALRGGVQAVQWRQKTGSLAAIWSELLRVRDLCRAHRVPFLVDDRVDVALGVDADGAHLGQDDLPAEVARKLLQDRLLGVSITALEQVGPAERAGADYLGVGPIFPTGSKPDAVGPLGLDFLRAVRLATELPLVAIGGISAENVARVREAGADAAAVLSAVCGAADVEAAARALVEQMEEAVTE